MTGQNPLHHGILRPPMYNEAGRPRRHGHPAAAALQQLGYFTQGVGKWHMGENEGSLPQNVGFDDYYGFLGVSDMYTEWRDVYFNPGSRADAGPLQDDGGGGFNHNNVHCTRARRRSARTAT